MVFELLAIIGVVGMALMALMGSVRIGHHAASPGHVGQGGHPGIGHGHSAGAHAHAQTAHTHAQGAHQNGQRRLPLASGQGAQIATGHGHHFNYWSLIPSPLDLFSFCFGAGAAGLLAQGHVAAPMLTTVAIVGALVFCFGITRPLFSFLLKFASKPSEGLEGTIALTAEAMTKFDEKGQGLVCVNMEGQLVQLLGRLSAEDMAHGVAVKKGEQVVVTDVDSKRGICTVTRELSL